MHDFVCVRCGEEIDWIYHSKNPDYEGWDLCLSCLRECDAEMMPDASKDQDADEKIV